MLLFAMLLRNAASGNQICGGFQLQSFSFCLSQCPEGAESPTGSLVPKTGGDPWPRTTPKMWQLKS